MPHTLTAHLPECVLTCMWALFHMYDLSLTPFACELFCCPSACQDLEAYAANYTGITKVQRLRFIAAHCPQLEQEALK